MAADPVRHRLDETRSVTAPSARHGIARRLVHGNHILAVHLRAWNAIASRSPRDIAAGKRVVDTCRDAPLVVEAHEDCRQAQYGSEIDCFMKRTGINRAVTEEDPSHLPATVLQCAQRETDPDWNGSSDNSRAAHQAYG